MNIENKLIAIAENEQKVYSAGYHEGYREGYSSGDVQGSTDLLNCLTNNKQRWNFIGFFRYSDCTGLTFDSSYFENATSANNLFYGYAGTELPKGVIMPKATDVGNGGFGAARLITEIYDMQIPVQSTWNNCFNLCDKLVTIGFAIKCDISTVFTNIFNGCKELTNVTFDGVIGKNISVSACSKLTYESIMSLINTLYDYASDGTAGTYTVTLGATNLAKLTDAEKAIATQKGWTLA